MFRRDSLYTLGSVLQLVIGAIVTPIITRLLGSGGYGRVAACVAVMQVLFTIEELGLAVGILRVVAMNGIEAGRAVLGMSLTATSVLSAGLIVTYPSWAPAFGFGSARNALLLTIIWSGLAASTWVSVALLRSSDRLGPVLVVDALQLAGTQVLGLTLAANTSDRVTAYLAGVVVAQALALLAGLAYTSPVLRLWRHRALLYRALLFSLPVLPLALSNFVLSASDRLILSRDLGAVAVGRYQVAYGLACVALLLVGALGSQWLPSLLRVESPSERRRTIELARERLVTLLVPSVLGLSAGVPELLRFWVSSRYDTATLTVVVVTVAASAIPFTLYTCHQVAVLVAGAPRVISATMIVCALVNIVLNIALVPLLGINGSAYATLIAYVVLWACTAAATRNLEIGPRSSLRVATFVMLAGGLAGATLVIPTTGLGGLLRWMITGGCITALATVAKVSGRAVPKERFAIEVPQMLASGNHDVEQRDIH